MFGMKKERTRPVKDFEELKRVQITIELLFSIIVELLLLTMAILALIKGWDFLETIIFFIFSIGFLIMLIYGQKIYFRIIRDIERILENKNIHAINIQKTRRTINDFIEFHLASKEDKIGFPEGLRLIYGLNHLSETGEWYKVYFKFPFDFPFLIHQFDTELKEFKEPTKLLKNIELVRSFSNDFKGKFFEIVLNFPIKNDLHNIHEQIDKILKVAKTIQNITYLKKVNLLPLKNHPRILASFQYFSFYRVCIPCEKVFKKMKYDRKSMFPERCPDCYSITVPLAKRYPGLSIQEKIRRIKELGIVVKNASGSDEKKADP